MYVVVSSCLQEEVNQAQVASYLPWVNMNRERARIVARTAARITVAVSLYYVVAAVTVVGRGLLTKKKKGRSGGP